MDFPRGARARAYLADHLVDLPGVHQSQVVLGRQAMEV